MVARWREKIHEGTGKEGSGWVAGEVSVQAVHINPRKRTKIPEQRAELV